MTQEEFNALIAKAIPFLMNQKGLEAFHSALRQLDEAGKELGVSFRLIHSDDQQGIEFVRIDTTPYVASHFTEGMPVFGKDCAFDRALFEE